MAIDDGDTFLYIYTTHDPISQMRCFSRTYTYHYQNNGDYDDTIATSSLQRSFL